METITTKQRILNSPITRIVLGLIVCFIAFIIAQQSGRILELTSLDKNYRNLIKGIIASAAVVSTYVFFFKKYEKREITEFSVKALISNIGLGVAIGVVLQCLTILVIYLIGGLEITAVNSASNMIIPFTVAFSVAIFEEILIRGIIFRVTEEKLGTCLALVISAVIFGALHLTNPNSTLLTALCVAFEAGFLMGAAYIYKRNLWFPIAIHFAWNFVQSGVFGAVTSGNENTSSLLSTKISGNSLITGGEFGPEATVQAIVFCTLAAIILFRLGKNKIIQPYWKNKNQ